MIYLFWSLLNLGLLIFFISILFRATQLIREKIGLFASIIFVVGIVSLISFDNDEKDIKPNETKRWEFIPEDSLKNNDIYIIDVELEETLSSKYHLSIKYGKSKENLNIPINAVCYHTGFKSGINWKPFNLIVNRTKDNNQFEYHLTGIIKWKLLGITFYTQSKEYHGFKSLEV